MAEKIITIDAVEQAASLFGSFDENIKIVEHELDVNIVSRGSDLRLWEMTKMSPVQSERLIRF